METVATVLNEKFIAKDKKPSQVSLPKSGKITSEFKELLLDYAPNKQVFLCRDKNICFFGTSPTLAELNRDYNKVAAQAWLIPQLDDISEFSNCKNVMKAEQIRACADMITTQYYYLKISELMLFFYKLKNGEYGQFYGSVSPMVIMGSLRQFLVERNDAIFQHESKLREEQRKKDMAGAITAEEYYAPRIDAIKQYFTTMIKILNTFLGLTKK